MRYFYPLKTTSDFIRPWPYPYLSGASISNDAEYMDFEYFETLMSFLNSRKSTPWGQGLGLDITSSFFLYSAPDYNFSYFKGPDVDSAPASYTPRIDEYIRHGWIDTIHAYGDFDGHGGFTRNHALRAFSELNKKNLSLKIFTNHGSVDNIQNIGRDASYHCGDIIDHVAYHADLLKQNGIEYLWTDSFSQAKAEPVKNLWHLARRIKRSFQDKEHAMIEDAILQDGSIFKCFWRFRSTGKNAPNLSSLAHQIEQIEWPKLNRLHGAIVIYQHLGVADKIDGQCTAANREAVTKDPQKYLNGFYLLKDLQDKGEVWIAGLYSFLDYITMIEKVRISKRNENNFLLEYLDHVSNPQRFFSGLTIYTDNPVHTTVSYKDTVLALTINNVDETKQNSVTVKIESKSDIWQ